MAPVRLMAKMPRRPLVIALVALVAALLLAPVVLLMLAGSGGAPPSSDSTDEGAAAEPLQVADVAWVYAAPRFGGGAASESYMLQAGRLGDEAPSVDLEVEWNADVSAHPMRMPAVGRAIRGGVVYVADDGARSSIRRVDLAGNGAHEELAAIEELVWSMAVTADGAHAYLALADRADPEHELGIVRMSLDGQARMDRILDPARPLGETWPRVMPVAIVTFDIAIELSPDERHIVRRMCERETGCRQEVIDVESGDIVDLGDRHLMGVAGGVALAQSCGAAGCGLEMLDLESGAIESLGAFEFEATMALVDGEARMLFVDHTQGGVIRALDPGDGTTVDVFRAPEGSFVMLAPLRPDVRFSLPSGYMLASVSGDDKGAIVQQLTVAIPLNGGPPIQLPEPPIHNELLGPRG